MTATRKRPKVRYVWTFMGYDPPRYEVFHRTAKDQFIAALCSCDTESAAKRIAAALNLHEAVKRGEM